VTMYKAKSQSLENRYRVEVDTVKESLAEVERELAGEKVTNPRP